MTLPSKTSGCPVASLTSMTSIPASLSLREVPPVDKICHPSPERAVPRASMPSLSQTLMRARGDAMTRD